jgi:hypothetical protein
MTEAEWWACETPSLLLECLRGEQYDRQRRLFVCACCRRLWHLLADGRSRAAVVTAERFADGLVTRQELEFSWDAAQFGLADMFTFPDEADAANVLAAQAAQWPTVTWFNIPALSRGEQAHILRDIVGPRLFRPAHVDPRWLSWHDGTVRGLSEEIAERQRFELLPILADALEDAGCTERAILGHCRGPGPHVRGCWVVDALLGRP